MTGQADASPNTPSRHQQPGSALAGWSQTRPLESTASLRYWPTRGHVPFAIQPALPQHSYDVIVIGGGIAGALMAEALAEDARSVLVVDRKSPLTGTTAACAALVMHELDTPLSVLAGRIGQEAAERIWHRSATSVERLVSLATQLGIDCEMERQGTIQVHPDEADMDALAAEARTRNMSGLKVRLLSRDSLRSEFGLSGGAGLLSSMSARVNPVQLAAGLLLEVTKRGGHVVANSEIIDVRPCGGRVHLLTSEGDFLDAGLAVFCTGHEFPDMLTHPQHQTVSRWAIATEPGLDLPSWLDEHLVWDSAGPALYFRAGPDGRILAAGEDEADPYAFHSPDKQKIKSEIIADRLSRLIGHGVGRVDYRWSAALGSTPNGIPFIGEVPGMPQVYAAMGLGSRGLTFARIAADIVRADVQGRKDHDADLFAFPSAAPSSLQA